jgi:hypothetical protein
VGYGLRVFLMVEERHVRIFGCQDWELLDQVLDAMGDEFADYDDEADVEEAGSITHAEALREIFAGAITRPEDGSIYGWAYELYCASMGERLNPNPFAPCNWAWYENLDSILRRHEVPLRLEKLVTDCPIPLPPPDPVPCVGHWNQADISAGRIPLCKLLERLEDREVADALRVVSEWLEQASAEPGSLIVGFHG